MKRILLFMLACMISMSLAAQTSPKSSKSKAKANEEEVNNSDENSTSATDDGDKKVKKTKAEIAKEKADKEKAERMEKLQQEKQERADKLQKDKEERAEKLKAQQQNKPASHTSSANKKKEVEDAPVPDPEVVEMYFDLPGESLPVVQQYIEREKKDVDNDDLKDGKDLRRGFIKNVDGNRGYLQLQRPGEPQYARIQEFKTKDFKRIMAVENTSCTGVCENSLKFYIKDGGEWKDVTDQYIYKPNPKTVISRLKDKYKEEYMDLDLFDSRGYDQEANYNKAITYTISSDENKIVIKEQYLPLPLYEMTWNADKGKFEVKKL